MKKSVVMSLKRRAYVSVMVRIPPETREKIREMVKKGQAEHLTEADILRAAVIYFVDDTTNRSEQ